MSAVGKFQKKLKTFIFFSVLEIFFHILSRKIFDYTLIPSFVFGTAGLMPDVLGSTLYSTVVRNIKTFKYCDAAYYVDNRIVMTRFRRDMDYCVRIPAVEVGRHIVGNKV